MRQTFQWWLLPQIREIGRDAGTPAVQEHLRQYGVEYARSTITDCFRRHGWPLKPTSPYDRGKTARGELVLPGEENAHSTGAAGNPVGRAFVSDKKTGALNWREANDVIRQMQALKTKASGSQDYATIRFLEHIDHPITITGLCDLHMTSWGSDPDTLERITDEILSIDDLYIGLLGDEEQMSIKMRSIMEIQDQMFPTGMQHMYFESWMDEIKDKLLFSTWENHAAMREEAATGFSYSSEIKKRRCVYFNGIGHADIVVGPHTYKFAVSHVFRGKSIYNATHGQQRYAKWEGQDRDVLMAGDSHTPGVTQWWESGRKKVALNGGSNQTNSGFGKRWFSLTTADTWPCVTLFPREKRMVPYWSIAEFLAATGRAHLIRYEEAA